MPRDPADIDLRRRLRRLEATRRRIEQIHGAGNLPRQDVERLYEGLFLSLMTGFERFLERYFFEVVLDDAKHSSRVLPRATFKSASTLRGFVLADRPFVDWLPYENTEERAKMFLRKGRPFTEVSEAGRQEMRRWTAVRNAIAHSSDHSAEKFRKIAIGHTPLPPRQRNPAGWLRSNAKLGLTRFELTAREAAQIAHLLVE